MANNITQRFPFSNKGLVQKLDVNQLSDGQYAFLLNMVSQQEGALVARNGYQDITLAPGPSPWPVSLVHSLAVTRSGVTSAPELYVGEGVNIYRIAISGTLYTYDPPIATNVAAAAKRIGFSQFKTDQYNHTGTTYIGTGYNSSSTSGGHDIYFRGMLRDAQHISGSYSSLARAWGILPPIIPAFPTPGAATLTPTGSVGSTTARYTDTVATATATSYNSDYYAIVPTTSIVGLQVGMYLTVGGLKTQISQIDAASSTFYAAFASAPSGAILSYERTANITYTAASDSNTISGSANLGLSGTYQTNYDSSDMIHLSFYNGTPDNIKTVALRLYTSSAGSYYESIQTINETAPPEAPGAYWIEFDIPKNTFTQNGTGGGSNSWHAITSTEVVVTSIDATVASTYNYGQIFGVGGGGPNSGSTDALFPYDYIYTYLDSETGAESNPSQVMESRNAITITNQPIKVTFFGTDNTTYNAGIDKVNIYRRGGSYTDGLFRKVGTATNPGMAVAADPLINPNPGSFYDTLADDSITGNVTAEFDNDAPVTSDLNKEYIGTLGSISSPNHSVTVTPVISGSPDLRTILTPGTEILINSPTSGITQTQETCYVTNVTATTFDTYFQNIHLTSESVSWSTNAGVAGDVLLAAQECMWVAGNTQNPHVLYRSKTGRPESFPIINAATGNAHFLAISSPDNPINGLAEFGGEIVVLCQNSIYTLTLDNGVIRGPFKTPANRGLTQKYAWGFVDNEIWFLSYDGIYAWAGSTVRKVSFAVDFIFNNQTVNGIAPYSATGIGVSDPLRPALCNIQQKNNEVFFNYVDTDNKYFVLRYNTVFDRWNIDEVYDTNSAQSTTRNGISNKTTSITCMISDRATGDLFAAKSTTVTGPATNAGLVYYNKEGFYMDGGISAPGNYRIYYGALSKYYDMAAPLSRKHFTDIGVEFNSAEVTALNAFHIQLYYDYAATVDATDQFTITPAATGRQIVALPLQQTGSPTVSAGKEARAMQWEIFGTTTNANTWNGMIFDFIPLSDLIKGRITDWDDLGHPYDKRLDAVTIEYDNNNSAVTVVLDTVTGVLGNIPIPNVEAITLPASTGRSKVTVPIIDGVVAKLVRMRPRVASAVYEIFDYKFVKYDYPKDRILFTDYTDEGYNFEKRLFVLYINCDTAGYDVPVQIVGDNAVLQTVTVNGTAANRMQAIPLNPDLIAKLIRLNIDPTVFNIFPLAKFQLFEHHFDYEKLPEPIILSTPWNDFGYDYTKWAEQITFDVNTSDSTASAKTVPVQIWGDGVLKQTVQVTATQATRSQNITLNPGITFQIMRLVVDPALIPSGGRFQLWEYKPVFSPSDKGAVFHSFDWDNLEHPYDKKISEVTIEFETGGVDVQVAIDTLTGINGATQNLNAITLTLNSAGRGYKTFPLPETVCKMVRIRCLGTSGGGTNSPDFKMWGYKFSNTIPYPADIALFTDWSDLGYSCDKIFRGVGIQIDTGGVACTVTLWVDGVSYTTWSVNTTSPTRQVFESPANTTEIIGKEYRLTFLPGTGGKAQVFGKPDWDIVKDACAFVSFDTFNQAFGSAGFTIIKQVWFDYKCPGTVTLKFYNQDGDLFWTEQVPAHTTRAVARFYLPSAYNGVNNKSQKHRMTVTADDATKPFKQFRDSSRIEYLNLSADQRKGYYEFITWQDLKLAV